MTISEVFLAHPGSSWAGQTPVRKHGTTHFVEDGGATGGVPTVTIARLREQHPDFAALRLVKSDTDGLDVALAPAIAREWRDTGPVIFFEFDPRLTRDAGFADPNQVWVDLAELGYTRAVVWDNGGSPLGQFDVADGARNAAVLDRGPDDLGYYFWDVAVCRGDDSVALTAFDQLVPNAFAVSRKR